MLEAVCVISRSQMFSSTSGQPPGLTGANLRPSRGCDSCDFRLAWQEAGRQLQSVVVAMETPWGFPFVLCQPQGPLTDFTKAYL